MTIKVLQEDDPFRLVTDGKGHYAVIEARWGHVYPLHRHDCCGADDTSDGMEIVAKTEWEDAREAVDEFEYARQCEQHYAEIIW